MSLPLRITFEGSDYSYTILTRTINKETTEIKIRVGSEEFTLIKNKENEWYAAEASIGDKTDLLKAIAKSVSLRYRL